MRLLEFLHSSIHDFIIKYDKKAGRKLWICLHLFYSASENGVWGQWGVFSACSETCGNGVRTRERKCDSPAPKYGGNWCKHTTYNNFDLPIESEYEVDCVPCNVKSCSSKL